MIKLHKSMVGTISDIDRTLSGTLKEVNNVLSDQRSFAAAIKAFQKNLIWNVESLNTQAQSYLARLMQNFEKATEAVLAKITLTIKDTEWQLAGLRGVSLNLRASWLYSGPDLLLQNIQKSGTEADNVLEKVIRAGSEISSSQGRQRSLAAELQKKLETLQSTEIHALLEAFGSIYNQLVSTRVSRKNWLWGID